MLVGILLRAQHVEAHVEHRAAGVEIGGVQILELQPFLIDTVPGICREMKEIARQGRSPRRS
jgi:hypothetical protein